MYVWIEQLTRVLLPLMQQTGVDTAEEVQVDTLAERMRQEAVKKGCTSSFQGVRSPYLESGNHGAEEAVVFVHGNPGSSKDWRDLLGQVGAFARAIAPDIPGYGQADKPKDFDYTVANYARHLDGILEPLINRPEEVTWFDGGGCHARFTS